MTSYRFMNRDKVRTPAFDMNQFTAPMQEVAYTLAAPFADGHEMPGMAKAGGDAETIDTVRRRITGTCQ
jgi:hypothetical protein